MNKVEIVRYGTVSVRCPFAFGSGGLQDLYGVRGCVKCKYHQRIELQHIYCSRNKKENSNEKTTT